MSKNNDLYILISENKLKVCLKKDSQINDPDMILRLCNGFSDQLFDQNITTACLEGFFTLPAAT